LGWLAGSKMGNQHSFPENETGYESQQQAAEVSLPGYAGKERKEKEDQDCCPERYGDGDGNYDDWRSGDYYCQGSAKGKNGS